MRGVSFEVGAGRDLRLPRPERRRQDDDAAHAHHPAAHRRRDGPRWPASTWPATRRQVRRAIGYVSQLGGADELATGRENLVLQGRLYGVDLATVDRPGRRGVGGPRPRRVRRPAGEDLLGRPAPAARRGARASCTSPRCSSSTSRRTGLDPQNRANLWDHLRALRDAGHDDRSHHPLPRGGRRALRPARDRGPRRRSWPRARPRDLKRQVAGDAVVHHAPATAPTAAPGAPASLGGRALRPRDHGRRRRSCGSTSRTAAPRCPSFCACSTASGSASAR